MIVDNLDTIRVEITNKCNARCPGCERTVDGDTHPDLKKNVVEYTLDDFKNMFPSNMVQGKEFYFGGTVDDPMMNKNVYDICEYVISNQGQVTLETNTGANNVDTYTKLGQLSHQSNGKLHVYFSVDGLEKTNHLYRVNVIWSKVLENMKAYSSNKGKCTWQYLVFDHNYKDVPEAKALADELGINLVLRQNVRNVKPWISKTKVKNKETKKIETKTFEVKTTEKFEHPELKKTTEIKQQVQPKRKSINCLMIHKGEIFVAWTKRVWPCCWFASDSFARYDYFKKLDEKLGSTWNDLHHNTLDQILGHEYYDKILQESWKNPQFKDYYYPFCYTKCGDNNARTHYHRESA